MRVFTRFQDRTHYWGVCNASIDSCKRRVLFLSCKWFPNFAMSEQKKFVQLEKHKQIEQEQENESGGYETEDEEEEEVQKSDNREKKNTEPTKLPPNAQHTPTTSKVGSYLLEFSFGYGKQTRSHTSTL